VRFLRRTQIYLRIIRTENKMDRIILASGSPRRKELLAGLGLNFTVMVSRAEEDRAEKDPEKLAAHLSQVKAREVAARLKGGTTVIGADTVVSADGMVLGKPADAADAERMIRCLQGHWHDVYTGVTLIRKSGGETTEKTFTSRTAVHICAMTDEEISDYICSGDDWGDKAGAYGIQNRFGMQFVDEIKGDYYTVVGLPVSRVYHELRSMNAI
jgi:septum formation protein